MAAIGDRLREARTRRGVDFDEVEAATKVRARYLRALESEQFDLLPGPTFVRTFLRTYAEYLGLDARLLVEEYRAQYEPADASESQVFSPVPGRPRDRPPMRGPGPLVLVAAGAFAVILLFLVLGLLSGGQESPAPDRGAQKARPGPTAAERARQRRRQRRKRAPRSVSMRVSPEVPTYLCVDDGAGKIRFQGTLTSARTFKGRRLRINLGKTSARVRVNGRAVPLDRTSADPVVYDFRPTSRKKLPPGQGPCT